MQLKVIRSTQKTTIRIRGIKDFDNDTLFKMKE